MDEREDRGVEARSDDRPGPPAGDDANLSHVETNRKVLDLLAAGDLAGRRVLDVGGGEGFFCRLLGDHIRRRYALEPGRILRSCDLNPQSFRCDGVACDRIDANDRLPYEDASFDDVVCIEVIEHIEDQFRLVRDFFRVMRPGGRLIVTTPNIMNVNSRLRQFVSGFGVLFNPLPLESRDAVHLEGHIHPVSFYYLAYIFHVAGFRKIGVYFDKRKRSAIAFMIPLYLPILAGYRIYRSYLKKRRPAAFKENEWLLRHVNTVDMLTSRSVILEGIK